MGLGRGVDEGLRFWVVDISSLPRYPVFKAIIRLALSSISNFKTSTCCRSLRRTSSNATVGGDHMLLTNPCLGVRQVQDPLWTAFRCTHHPTPRAKAGSSLKLGISPIFRTTTPSPPPQNGPMASRERKTNPHKRAPDTTAPPPKTSRTPLSAYLASSMP